MEKPMTFAAILGFAAALAAPSAEPQTAAAPTPRKSVTVYVVQRVMFEPPTWGFDQMAITIPPGTTVTWKSVPGNSDRHTSTSYDDVWNSPFLNPGDTWSFTFSKAGRYRYHCTPHPWMVGTVNVVAGAPLPPAISAPTPETR
jgi:plastocyanin